MFAQAQGKFRHLFQTTTTFPSREWLHESLRIFRDEVQHVKSVEALNPQLITYTIPSQAIRGMTRRGGNSLGLANVRGPLFSEYISHFYPVDPNCTRQSLPAHRLQLSPPPVTLLALAWRSPADDALIYDFGDRVIARLETLARGFKVHHPFKYVGYGRAGQDIFSSYGAENHKRLLKTQRAVDPRAIFTTRGLCRGGFKIR